VTARVARALGSITLAAVLLAACGTVSPTTAMKNWTASSNLRANAAQLVLDARHALATLDQPRSTVAQLHTVCAVLNLETLQANSALPTPDAQTTSLLAGAYNDLGAGANACYRSAASEARRQTARTYLRRAGALLSEALARVATLGA